MSSSWSSFIEEALQEKVDDPFVRLLRERIKAGCQIIRINLVTNKDPSISVEYLIVLSCEKQLSEMRIPHSESFTRWSLENGVRLETAEEEAQRFVLLACDGLQLIEQDVGKDYLDSILVNYLKELAPPLVMQRLVSHHSYQPSLDTAMDRAILGLESLFVSLARNLGRNLGYGVEDTAQILDAALESLVNDRFHLDLRDALFPHHVR